jgi:hypothetical protein
MNYPYRGGIVRECVRVLAGQGSSKSLDAAEAAIIKGGLKSMDSVGEAVRVYVRILGSNHKRVRPFVVKAMKTYKGRQRTHDIVGACIPAACKGLQEMLGDIYLRGRSNWHNAEYNKDVMPSVRLAVQLKLHPLKDPRRNADGWLYLVRRQSSSGYCLDYILDALIAETARETRPYVIEKLRSMTTKGYTNKRLLAVIRALGGSLTPREAKALEKYKRI